MPSERDGFIAETAVKLDQLQASQRVFAREVADLVSRVTKIEEVAGQDQSQARAKEDSVDEVARVCRDLKARLDRIETRSDGDYHAYNSFEAVSRKLGELERPRRAARRWLFRGSLVIAAAISIGPLLRHAQL